jgi:tetratricopeptide (TPR) repeat protein
MQELAAEREAIKTALDELRIDAWVFERDAGARSQTIQETYLEEVEAADLYIGLFWKSYGQYTIEEYEHARMLGMDCLIYEKRGDIQGQRDPELQAFLDRISEVESGHTVRWFNTLADLRTFVKEDVAAWQAKIVREGRQSSLPAVYAGVPPMPTHFVGRSELVLKMARRLRSGEDVAVEGLPGVGKTTLAVALTRHIGVRRNFKDGILWASLGPHADVSGALTSWAEALKKDLTRLNSAAERAQAIRDAIGQKRMLLVIDDVWDLDAANVLRCGGPNCCYALTTRDKAVARAFVGAPRAENLPTLDDDQAYQLLQALAPEACAADPRAVRGLANAVGGLPLAIGLIGGYLAAPERSMFPDLFPDLSEEAIAEMANPHKRLQLAEKRLGVFSGEKITLQDTIALSLDGLPDSAREAFYALGAFAPKPERFGREAAEAVTQAGAAVLALLAARNLLEIVEEGRQLTLHQTIADVARARLEETAVARHRDYYMTLVKQGQNQYDWWLIFDVYGQIRQAWQNTPEEALLLDWLSALYPYFNGRSLWQEYLEWANRALAMVVSRGMRKEEGPLLSNIGLAHYYLGQWEKAIAHFQEAQPILEEVGARVGFARTLHNIGMARHAMGEKEKMLDHFQQALSTLENTDDRIGLAQALSNIAMIHLELGDDLKASALLGQAEIIKVDNKDLAPEHSHHEVYLAYTFRLARELGEQPQLLTVIDTIVSQDEADVDFEGHIAIGVKREEDEKWRFWHAVFRKGKKLYAEYKDYLPYETDALLAMGEREADAILSKGSLPDNPKLLELGGDRELFQKFFARYIQSSPEILGPQKDAEKLHAIGGFLASSGQPALAIPNYDRVIEIRTRLVEKEGRGELANDLAESLNSRGRAFASLEKFPEAVRDFDKAIEIRTQIVEGEGKIEFARNLSVSLSDRARVMIAESRYPEAIRDYDRAIEIETKLIEGEGHKDLDKDLATNLSYRGLVLNVLGQDVEAARDYGKAIELFTRLLEEQGQPELAGVLASNLSSRAAILNSLGQAAEAVGDYSKAIEIRRRLMGQEGEEKLTQDLAVDLKKRGYAYAALNRVQETVQDFNEAIALYTHLVDERGQRNAARSLAELLSTSGLLHGILNQAPEAQNLFKQAIERYTQLVDEQGHEDLAKDLASSLCKYAQLMTSASRLSDALENYDRAVKIYTRLIEEQGGAEVKKELADSLYNRGNILEEQDRFDEAIGDYQRAANLYAQLIEMGDKLATEFAWLLNSLAWLQATCIEEGFRNGAKAVENATHACELTDWNDYRLFDTLAASYAEARDFDMAIKWQTKALDAASDEEKVDIRSRLDLYHAERPYRHAHRAQ